MDRFIGLISKKDKGLDNKNSTIEEFLDKVDTKREYSLDFDKLASFVDGVLSLAESKRIKTNEHGDTFKYTELSRRVVNRKSKKEGIEEVALVREEGLSSDPGFAHLFAKSEDGVIGSNDIIIGVVRLDGEELRSRIGESTKRYTGDEVKKVIKNAYDLCMIDW